MNNEADIINMLIEYHQAISLIYRHTILPFHTKKEYSK